MLLCKTKTPMFNQINFLSPSFTS